MRIVVERLLSTTLIEFTGRCGGGIATWRGDAPQPGSSHEVELEIPDPLTWNINVRFAQSHGAAIKRGQGVTDITCGVESELEDGLVLLRIENSVLTVDISGHPELAPGSWLRLTLPPANLELFPYST